MIYLYVKVHNKTGLRYLGKTTKTDYHGYAGSGKAWIKHLKQFGFDYSTILIRECINQTELSYWGRYYSRLWNVTSAMDDYGNLIYANLIPETGGGALYGEMNPSKRIEVKATKKAKMLHVKRPEISEKISQTWTEERKQNQRAKTSGENHYTHRKNLIGDSHPLKNKKRPGTGLAGNLNPARRPEVREKMRGPRGNNTKISGSKHYTKSTGYVSKISGQQHYTKKCTFEVKETNKNYDHALYHWKNIQTGEEAVLTRREFIKKYDLRPSDVCQVINGKRKKTKFWVLIQKLINQVES